MSDEQREADLKAFRDYSNAHVGVIETRLDFWLAACTYARTAQPPSGEPGYEYQNGYEAGRAAQGQWVAVSERLPDEGVSVLGWNGQRALTMYLDDCDWIGTAWGDDFEDGSISYRRPLPAPPQVTPR